jgi:hypothetical protein
LRDDNMHWRLMAQRLLVERGDTDVLPQLYRMVSDVRVDQLGLNPGALHALWTMHGLGALDGDHPEALAAAAAALHHPAPGVRRAAVIVLPAREESLEAILDAGLLPDRTAAGEMDYMVDSAAMDPADAQVRLAAVLALADMPPSDRAGRAIAELALVRENAGDHWLREASAIAGARHADGFLERLLQEDLGDRRADSAYVANIVHVAATAAAELSANQPSGRLAELLKQFPGADPVVASAILDGFVAGASRPPDLTPQDRADIRAAHSEMSTDLRVSMEALADKWQLPDLLLEDEN